MENQKKLFEEVKWDYLVVLDACRYDYFKKVYGRFLPGSLRKVISPGRFTQEWVEETFDNKVYNDTIYVSGCPHINSKGIPVGDFYADEHFYRIVDVWDKGWKSELGTTPPEEVNKHAILMNDFHPKKRLIIHYMQPHYPYLSLGGDPEKRKRGLDRENQNFTSIKQSIGVWIRKKLGQEFLWRILDSLGRDLKWMGKIWKNHGKNGLRKAYKNNVRIVLEKVSALEKNLEGKMVVTGDHGDLLGENGIYGHPNWSDSPILREVPWFEVEG